MHVLGFKRLPLGPILAFLTLLPLGVEGQLRTVVSNEIAVSEQEATLRLDFRDEGELTISFHEGQVLVDGASVGTYSRRDGLDLAWRALLGEVITLDDGPLAAALNDWDPPQALTGNSADLADRLDETLEKSLVLSETSADPSTEAEIAISLGGEEGLVGALLSRSGALSGLAAALEGVPLDDFVLKIGEDMVVGAGEELDGSLILVDGDLDVRGKISGDVVLTGGTVRLMEGGVIVGDLRVSDGEIERSGGTIEGRFLVSAHDEVRVDEADLEEMRSELESVRRDLRSARERRGRSSSNVVTRFVGNVGSAIAGLLENLVSFLVLSILGVLAVHFQRERLEVVATTAWRAPMRSAVVGLAGGFFIIPVWIVGMIALAISIIGIPVLLVWIPLFPIVAALAGLLGFLAVARNVGEWVAEQEYRGLEWIRGSNMFYTVVAGVGALMVPIIASSVSRILGFDILTGLLGFVGSMVSLAVTAVGFGAVLLTRGGKIRPLESYYDFEEDYWADTEAKDSAQADETEQADPPVDQGESGDASVDAAETPAEGGETPADPEEAGEGTDHDGGQSPSDPSDAEHKDEDGHAGNWPTTALAAVALLLAAVPSEGTSQSWRSVTMSRQLSGEGAMDVRVRFGAGRLSIEPGEPGNLYKMHLRYDEDAFEPVAEYEPGRLELGVEGTKHDIRWRKDDTQEMELFLARGVPMNLDLEFGAVRADLDLGGLHMMGLDLRTGASESRVDFSELNPIRMSSANLEIGTADFLVRNLGNLNADRISVDAGVGNVVLDFRGNWQGNSEVFVDMGLGALELRFPEGLGVRLMKDTFLTSLDSEGLVKRGDSYYSVDWEEADHRITVSVDAAFGSIDVVWVH